MSRIAFGGTLSPGGLIGLARVGPATISIPRAIGTYALAHPRFPPAPATTTPTLVTFDHGKFLLGGVYRYSFFIRHAAGFGPVVFDVDMS
jgi:hypothetical protein